MKRVVWVVSEGSPGHVSQSEGLVAELASQIALESVVIQVRPRLNGFARGLVRWWMGSEGRALPNRFLVRWLRCQVPPGSPRPDFIVASGGKSVFAARSLAVRWGAPLVFLGERKPYPSEWFHTVFTPSPCEVGVNDVAVEMIPTRVNRELAEAAAKSWPDRPEGRLWAMVIGGSSATHHFQMSDWDELGAAMNTVARSEGIRWLVTTSRRTGSEAEIRLRAALASEVVAAAVWWAENPKREMLLFLGAAECVVVTQDSVTMVTEAVASARPVLVICPEETEFPPTSFLPAYFENLEGKKRIKRMKIRALNRYRHEIHHFQPVFVPIERTVAAALILRLGF